MTGTMLLTVPSPKVFSALISGDVKRLADCSPDELRPFLPCLARMVLCSSRPSPVAMAKELSTPSGDKSVWEGRRKVVHALIAGVGEVNAISKYLALDFHVSIAEFRLIICVHERPLKCTNNCPPLYLSMGQ